MMYIEILKECSTQLDVAKFLMDDLVLPAFYKKMLSAGELPSFFAKAYGCAALDEYIRSFQERTGCLVYYVTYSETSFGNMYSLLCVSLYEEDWKHHLAYMKDGKYAVWCWVWNTTYEACSEYGTIIVENDRGHLFRLE